MSVYAPFFDELVATIQPQSLLVLDPINEKIPYEVPQVVHLKRDFWDELQLIDTCDLGIVAHTLEQVDRRTGELLLGRLRDVATRRFVVQMPISNTQWTTGDFLAFGLHELAKYRVANTDYQLFHYAIKTYKTVPDWFNSHHWAHPQNWHP